MSVLQTINAVAERFWKVHLLRPKRVELDPVDLMALRNELSVIEPGIGHDPRFKAVTKINCLFGPLEVWPVAMGESAICGRRKMGRYEVVLWTREPLRSEQN